MSGQNKTQDSTTKQLAQSSDTLYFDYSDRILIGTGLNSYNNSFIFRNITANLQGKLSNDFFTSAFDKKLDRWVFTPAVNRNFASVFLSCRYGTFSHQQSIDFGAQTSTKVKSYGASLPYKNLSLTFDYIRYTGFYRIDPLSETKTFRNNMQVTPVSVYFEYTGKSPKWMLQFSSLKNNYVYVPKYSMGVASVIFGYTGLTIKDTSDFISALRYSDSTNSANRIELAEGQYLNKFTSKGGMIGVRYSYYLPLYKSGSNSTFKTLYLKLNVVYTANIQSYRYYSITNNFSTTQFRRYQKGTAPSQQYDAAGGLVYDTGTWYFAATASYYSKLYGSQTRSYVEGNGVRDQRFSFHLSAAYRFLFKPLRKFLK